MNRFLFDTNVWITLLKRRNDLLLVRWRNTLVDQILVCAIVEAELWHGACKYGNPDQRRKIVDQWLDPYESLPFDSVAADRYAALKHTLEIRGELIGPNDMKIAAICLAHDLTLVTGNLAEFRRVPGLRLEDWSAV